jgi:integrase
VIPLQEITMSIIHLLVVLRSQGAIAPVALKATAVDEELRCYDEYMDHARGLVPKTRSTALRIIGRLLTSRFGGVTIDIAAIKPEQARRFFAQEAVHYSKPASLASVVASLRGYFRYRTSLGDLVHGGLIGAIPYPANWQLSSLPKTLTTEEVEQLVRSLDQPGRSMRRADAIVCCALDLGLRSGEVAQLGLDDIDWRAGTVTLRHTKGCREDVLPLPATTGQAIAAYLKHERPKTTNRAIFVRHIAPRDEPVGAMLLQVFYSIRSERQLMEQTQYNLLFRWFIGLAMDDAVWVPTVFTKNRERLIEHDAVIELFNLVLQQAEHKGLLSGEDFSVDGTLIQAWAGHKSFCRKDGRDDGSDSGNFKGESRSNDTHESSTNSDARLYCKGDNASRLHYMGHTLTDNRHGLIANAMVTTADGYAEREAAKTMINDARPSVRQSTGRNHAGC